MDLSFLTKTPPMKLFKVLIAAMVVIFVLTLLFSFVSERSGRMGYGGSGLSQMLPGDDGVATRDFDTSYGRGEMAVMPTSPMGAPDMMPGKMAYPSPMPPYGGTTVGSNAEEYEVTEYSASIEARNKSEICGKIVELKGRSEVIFENASEYRTGCSYIFKVEQAKKDEILNVIKGLGPKELTDSTYTIKQQLTDIESEQNILAKKLQSLDETLTSALASYNELTQIAQSAGEPQALARVIESKLDMIERLTNQKLETSAELDRLTRAKAENEDRLKYARFSVSVYESKYVDGQLLKDSWKMALQKFVMCVNKALQAATIGFIGFLVMLLPYALYFVVILLVVKYGWRFTRDIWNR